MNNNNMKIENIKNKWFIEKFNCEYKVNKISRFKLSKITNFKRVDQITEAQVNYYTTSNVSREIKKLIPDGFDKLDYSHLLEVVPEIQRNIKTKKNELDRKILARRIICNILNIIRIIQNVIFGISLGFILYTIFTDIFYSTINITLIEAFIVFLSPAFIVILISAPEIIIRNIIIKYVCLAIAKSTSNVVNDFLETSNKIKYRLLKNFIDDVIFPTNENKCEEEIQNVLK